MRIEILNFLSSAATGPSTESDIFSLNGFLIAKYSGSSLAEIKSTLSQMVADKVIVATGDYAMLGAKIHGTIRTLSNTNIQAQITDKGELEVKPSGTITKTIRTALLTFMSHNGFRSVNIAPFLNSSYPAVSARNIKSILDSINSDNVGAISGSYSSLGASFGGVPRTTANTVIHGAITPKGLKELGLS